MILNNTHIQGIFIYQPDIEYEKGDFVVSGNSIYICTAGNPNTGSNTVIGVDPAEDTENYTIYLGGSIKNIEEYFSYIDNPSVEQDDKFIKASLLSQILSTYMVGFDEKGIITDYVYQDSVGKILLSDNLNKFVGGENNELVLDKILKADDINNAMFKLSRELKDIKMLFPAFCELGFNIKHHGGQGEDLYLTIPEESDVPTLAGPDDIGQELTMAQDDSGYCVIRDYNTRKYISLVNDSSDDLCLVSSVGDNLGKFEIVTNDSGISAIRCLGNNKYLSGQGSSLKAADGGYEWIISTIGGTIRFSPEQNIEDLFDSEDLKYVILRQYTYTNGYLIPKPDGEEEEPDPEPEYSHKDFWEENYPECFPDTPEEPDPEPEIPGGEEETGDPDTAIYRLQELIDPIRGMTYYRHAKSSSPGSWEISQWKTDYDPNFILSINKLEESYRQAIQDLNEERENLKNYFRFREINIERTTGTITLQCENPDDLYYIPVSDFSSGSCVITVTAQLWDTNTTITVDILDSYMAVSNLLTYSLTDTSYLTVEPCTRDVTPDGTDRYQTRVNLRVNNGNIVNIYYREKYSGV